MLRPVGVVTGATGGLGYAVAELLALAGHRVVLTGRNEAKGQAALARLRRAAPAAEPGGYYGPANFGETRGPPAPSKVMPQARDEAAAARLWTVSEQLAGVREPAASQAEAQLSRGAVANL